MNDTITKHEYKILKMFYLYNAMSVAEVNTYTSKHPYSKDSFRFLHKNGYLEMTPNFKNHIVIGTKDEIRITDKGRRAYIAYKEEHRMFNKQIVSNQIFIPVIVTLLTNALIYVLQWLLPLIQQSLASFLN